MEKIVFINIFSILFLDSNTVYTCRMEENAKQSRATKSCVTSFRKKDAKVGQKPCGAPCKRMAHEGEGMAHEGEGIVHGDEGMAQEGEGMAHAMEAGGTIQTLVQRSAPGFVGKGKFTTHFHKTMQKSLYLIPR